MSTQHGMKARLARELGISGTAVAKLARRGMPIHDADAARRWRAQHLNPSKVAPDPGPSADTLLQRARALVDVAQAAHERHRLDLVADDLRAAMRAVPESHRGRLVMSFELWGALIGHHSMIVLDEGGHEELPPEDAEYVGEVCYQLACGEACIK